MRSHLSWVASQVRLTPRWRLLVALLAPAALALAALAAVLLFAGPRAADTPAPPAATTGEELRAGGLLVEVTGAVARPGLYRLTRGERVSAAIAAAGGLTAVADPERLPNMAARLQDGQQIRVPTSRGPASRGSRVPDVDLNSATVDELAAVPGFTRELAAAAVRYRTEYGGFATIRELVDVLQMSEASYLLARSHVRV